MNTIKQMLRRWLHSDEREKLRISLDRSLASPDERPTTAATAEHIDNLETAKVITAIHVNQYMGDYRNANTHRTRAIPAGPKKIPAGVFKVD